MIQTTPASTPPTTTVTSHPFYYNKPYCDKLQHVYGKHYCLESSLVNLAVHSLGVWTFKAFQNWRGNNTVIAIIIQIMFCTCKTASTLLFH